MTAAVGRVVVVVVFFIASATWVGGLAVLLVVVRAARVSLAPPDRIAFYQALGRRYLLAVGIAFVLAVTTGPWLVRARPWDAAMTALTLCVATLAVATVAGVVQARAMTRRRRRGTDSPADQVLAQEVVAGARRAVVLRVTIVVLSLASVVLGSVVATG